jgi:hypothetical protein
MGTHFVENQMGNLKDSVSARCTPGRDMRMAMEPAISDLLQPRFET